MADHDEYHPPNLLCEHCLAKFLFDQEGFVINLQGHELTKNYVELHGFSNPIKVELADGLELQVPVGNYDHFLNRLGDDRMVDVIHVEDSKIVKMRLAEFIDHVRHPEENKTYSMQSLELTSTAMRDEVTPPAFVRSIDIIEQAWSLPEVMEPKVTEPDKRDEKPEASRFLQINMAGSYINFHLDASGSSIWHHVLSGTEVLYLIKGPVETIATKYGEWHLGPLVESSNSDPTEDDDELEFHRVEVSEGETIFLPGGFFRAMLYPVDTIVVGGNYFNIFNIDAHLRIQGMETLYDGNRTVRKWIFPNFSEVIWRFAYKVCRDFIGAKTFSFSQCIFDQLDCLLRHLGEGNGFEQVSKKLEKVGASNIIDDLEFILNNAIPDPNNGGHLLLDSEGYDPSSF